MNSKKVLKSTAVIFLFFICLNAYTQDSKIFTSVKGTVFDAETNEPIPFVGIIWNDKSNIGTLTDDEGNFVITTKDTTSRIILSCIGYKNEIVKINVGQKQAISINLQPDVKSLNAVIVKPKKFKYRNKGNPAVELIDSVIENKSKNRVEDINFYEYEKYEKLVFSLTDYSEKFKNSKILKSFKFIFDNVDTTIIPGEKAIPVFLKETLSDVYYRKQSEEKTEFTKANKMVRFDEYVNSRSVNASLKMLYHDVNIYDNNILLLSNQFISPISYIAPTFYKYFIMDTSMVGNSKCIRLAFFPRNKTDFLFEGNLYIMLDSSYAVKKIDMTISKSINLNWVKNLRIIQEFEKIQDYGWMLTTDEISIDFGVTEEKLGIYGQKTTSYKNYQLDETKADSIYAAISKNRNKDIENDTEAYWSSRRPLQLSNPEQRVYTLMDSLKKVPAFKRAVDVTLLASTGFISALWPVEIGPANTFYSYNPIEGSRLRFGGRTTPRFSKKIYFNSYVAYGTTDEKYKYYVGTTYLFTNKTIFDFPLKTLTISYLNDIKIPGQELLYTQENNILLSFKRGTNDLMNYDKTFKIEHLNEFENHFSYTAAYEYTRQTPTGGLYYNSTNYMLHLNNPSYINISQFDLDLRYAPNEQFFQSRLYRIPIVNKYPVFLFQYSLGSRLISNDYNYQKLSLSVSKRFYLSFLGYTDVTCEAGEIFGKVPYPLLDISRANQTYSYQPLSYNLMNFLEFVNDKYVALFADHCFNGLIFNKVPLLKALKLREYVTCKVLYGGLNKTNDPNSQSGLFQLPVDNTGKPITYTFGNVPYVETSVGVSNILKFFRVDYVQRLTYLNHPNISTTGLRVSIKMDF